MEKPGSLSAEQESDSATPGSLDSLQEKKKTESQIVMNSNGETVLFQQNKRAI